MSKEQGSANKKATLTDAELQQVTGGTITVTIPIQECKAQSDKANCEKRDYCQWKEGKDGYSCDVCGVHTSIDEE